MVKFKEAFSILKKAAIKHSPEILTGIGIAGMVTSTVLAVRATPKALYLIDAAKDEYETDSLTPIETIKVAYKPYIPAAVTATLSITCLIGASAKNSKRNAALTAAYKISETALSEYREKVIETIGEKKEKRIREEIGKDRIQKNPVTKTEVLVASNGKTLCYDSISARYFNCDMETIRRAMNNLNKDMMDEMCISLSEFYDELDLDHTAISDELGWNVDDGLIDISFSSHIADDGRPCLVIDFDRPPKYNFHHLY